MYCAGIDVGTTNIKAVILDAERGEVRGVGRSPTITHHPRPEWSEFDADELWAAVLHSLRTAIAHCDAPERIRALAVASMGEAGFPLDARGEVLSAAIAWHDPRTAEQAVRWQERLGREAIYDITGQVLHPGFGLNKLLWLREHAPDTFARLRRWLSIEDFVLWKLSGVPATDYSIASRTMAFDQRAHGWSKPLLELAGMPDDWFARPYPSGTAIGPLQAEVARDLGLPQETLVVTGGHDHLCGALAAGVTRPGQLLHSMGTASALLTVSTDFRVSGALLEAGYGCYAYVLPSCYVTLGSLSFSGGALDWLVHLLYGPSSRDDAPDDDEDRFAVFARALDEANRVPVGARGAVVLPYLLGTGTPFAREQARGSIQGLSPVHGRAELLRAMLEGLAFWLRDNLAALRALGVVQTAPEDTEIVTIGGGVRAHTLMQIQADVTGCRVRTPHLTEPTAAGAALLAGVGAGAFASGEEAAGALRYADRVYEPRTEHVADYERAYTLGYLPARKAVLGR